MMAYFQVLTTGADDPKLGHCPSVFLEVDSMGDSGFLPSVFLLVEFFRSLLRQLNFEHTSNSKYNATKRDLY